MVNYCGRTVGSVLGNWFFFIYIDGRLRKTLPKLETLEDMVFIQIVILLYLRLLVPLDHRHYGINGL